MPKTHRPKRGSHGFSPRVRASSQVPRFDSWPDGGETPKIQGFAGFKAGMTHAVITDFRRNTQTAGKEVTVPVTVVEVPPMRIAAIRYYRSTPYGLKTAGETWATDVDPALKRRTPVPKEPKTFEPDAAKVDDVRVLAYTRPANVKSIPRKVPDIMELRIGGGSIEERIAFATEKLGAEVTVDEFTTTGQMIDVAAVTKGFGVQGAVPRWGVKMQYHKNSKNRRDASPLGPFQPRFIRSTVPMPGQTGYHNRVDFNKRVLKMGTDGEEITPAGGFLNYGLVRNPYILLHGSIPGPAKRLIRLRDATRYNAGVEVSEPEIAYISTSSKQGR